MGYHLEYLNDLIVVIDHKYIDWCISRSNREDSDTGLANEGYCTVLLFVQCLSIAYQCMNTVLWIMAADVLITDMYVTFQM